jgi:hypothetical protein
MTTGISGDTELPPAASAGAPEAPSGFLRRNRWKFILTGLVVALLGLGALYTLVTLKFSYSSGERVGYIQKLSKKGWICETWEGELAMSPVPGATPQIFPFSLRDPALAQQISATEGKRVALQYEEKRGVPSSCFGETNYFIVGVRTLGH